MDPNEKGGKDWPYEDVGTLVLDNGDDIQQELLVYLHFHFVLVCMVGKALCDWWESQTQVAGPAGTMTVTEMSKIFALMNQ